MERFHVGRNTTIDKFQIPNSFIPFELQMERNLSSCVKNWTRFSFRDNYNMAERNEVAHAEEKTTLMDSAPNVEEDVSLSQEDPGDVDTCNENEMPSQQQEQEEMIKKKYGGLLLKKKPPLISKDHERAFFDSADWALGKKGKGPVEALQPKLQPTPHHQVRSRSPCAPADEAEENHGSSDELSPSETHNLSPADENP